MFKCKFCNKEFSKKVGITNHTVRKENINFKDNVEMEKYLLDLIYGKELVNNLIQSYINEELCINDLSKMNISLSKYLNLIGVKRNSKEERKTKRYKETYLNGIRLKYGEGITNISQANEVKAKKEKTYSERYGSVKNYYEIQRNLMGLGYAEYCNTPQNLLNRKNKANETCQVRYGVDNPSKLAWVKKSISKKAKERISNMSEDEKREMTSTARQSVCSRGGYESKIEKRIQHVLVEMGIDFKKHVHLWNYNYDILIDTNNIIEVQGDMWHANPLYYKSTDLIMGKLLAEDLWNKDAKKKIKAEENGYTIIYIWENEIRKRNDIELFEYVKSLLKEIYYEL